MLIWIFALVFALAVTLYALRPFLSSDADEAQSRAAHDVSAFKAQLKEVDQDLARGVLSEKEAEGARIEISRRLLAAADAMAQEDSPRPAPRGVGRGVALATGAAIVAGSLGLYASIGEPNPPAPKTVEAGPAERLSQQQAEAIARENNLVTIPEPPEKVPGLPDFETLLTQLEEKVAENPDSPEGRILLARTYNRFGRYSDAAEQYENYIRIMGADTPAAAYSAMGEAMALATGGYISPEAEAAFETAIDRDPLDYQARYFKALGAMQLGKGEQAVSEWAQMLREDPDADWAPMVREQAVAAAVEAGLDPVAVLPGATEQPGPTREQMRDAASMTPEQRQEMIEGMVAGLAERLAEDPEDLAGWLRLIRAYRVLGRGEDAETALVTARETFAEDPEALAQLDRVGGGG